MLPINNSDIKTTIKESTKDVINVSIKILFLILSVFVIVYSFRVFDNHVHKLSPNIGDSENYSIVKNIKEYNTEKNDGNSFCLTYKYKNCSSKGIIDNTKTKNFKSDFTVQVDDTVFNVLYNRFSQYNILYINDKKIAILDEITDNPSDYNKEFILSSLFILLIFCLITIISTANISDFLKINFNIPLLLRLSFHLTLFSILLYFNSQRTIDDPINFFSTFDWFRPIILIPIIYSLFFSLFYFSLSKPLVKTTTNTKETNSSSKIFFNFVINKTKENIEVFLNFIKSKNKLLPYFKSLFNGIKIISAIVLFLVLVAWIILKTFSLMKPEYPINESFHLLKSINTQLIKNNKVEDLCLNTEYKKCAFEGAFKYNNSKYKRSMNVQNFKGIIDEFLIEANNEQSMILINGEKTLKVNDFIKINRKGYHGYFTFGCLTILILSLITFKYFFNLGKLDNIDMPPPSHFSTGKYLLFYISSISLLFIIFLTYNKFFHYENMYQEINQSFYNSPIFYFIIISTFATIYINTIVDNLRIKIELSKKE
jgi:hypothetical protein